MKFQKSPNLVNDVLSTIKIKKINHFLFHLCLMVVAQSLIVSGYLNSINTTIERRYKLTSKEIGLIYLTYELSCIPTTIILSIISRSINRPRLLGISGLSISLGMFLFSVPHFIGSNYELIICNKNSSKILCDGKESNLNMACPAKNTDKWAFYIFCFSQFLIGIGASPIYLLGPTYLWDNLSSKKYSIYSAIFYTCTGLGPPIGFLVGGLALGIYIDIPIYSKCGNMNNKHPLWLGAWWIGLVVVAGITVIVAFPLLTFPKDFSNNKNINKAPTLNDKSVIMIKNVYENKDEKVSQEEDRKHLAFIQSPKSTISLYSKVLKFILESFYELTKLFANSVWFFISLTTVMENIIVQACTTFISKYLQVIYNVPANQASYIVGGIVVPGAIAGVAFGGLIMNRLQPTITTAIKIMIIIIFSSGIMNLILVFLSCNDLRVVGVSVGYSNKVTMNKYNLVSECNSHCKCLIENYEPICDPKTLKNYYSPCHAGCRSIFNISNRDLFYSNCACTKTKTLIIGKCYPKCFTYYITLVVIFCMVFLTATGQIPINIITLSSVDAEHSPLALGVQVFMVRLLAFIPVPIYFGALFDLVCLARIKDECNSGSICREYNLYLLPFIWLGSTACIKILSLILVIATYICAKNKQPKTMTNTGIEVDDNKCDYKK